MRLISTYSLGDRVAKVFLNAEWGEYVVRFYLSGEHQVDADYHTDDIADAHGTALFWTNEPEITHE